MVRLIMDSEAMVTSEGIKSSEAMRILRRVDSVRNDEYPRRRDILHQERHTQGRTFRGRNDVQGMTSCNIQKKFKKLKLTILDLIC